MQKLKFGNLYWERTPIRLSAKQTKAEGLSGFPARFHERTYSSVMQFTKWYLEQVREVESHLLRVANEYRLGNNRFKNFYDLYTDKDSYEAYAFNGIRRVYEICAERFMNFVFRSIHKITAQNCKVLVSEELISERRYNDFGAKVYVLPVYMPIDPKDAFLGNIMYRIQRRFVIEFDHQEFYTCVLPENSDPEEILQALSGHLDGVCYLDGTDLCF